MSSEAGEKESASTAVAATASTAAAAPTEPAVPAAGTVTVMEMTGRKADYPAAPTDTFADVGERIRAARGIPVDQMIFVFGARRCAPGDTLESYGITCSGEQIRMLLNLRGD